jgi:hypothetical protein
VNSSSDLSQEQIMILINNAIIKLKSRRVGFIADKTYDYLKKLIPSIQLKLDNNFPMNIYRVDFNTYQSYIHEWLIDEIDKENFNDEDFFQALEDLRIEYNKDPSDTRTKMHVHEIATYFNKIFKAAVEKVEHDEEEPAVGAAQNGLNAENAARAKAAAPKASKILGLPPTAILPAAAKIVGVPRVGRGLNRTYVPFSVAAEKLRREKAAAVPRENIFDKLKKLNEHLTDDYNIDIFEGSEEDLNNLFTKANSGGLVEDGYTPLEWIVRNSTRPDLLLKLFDDNITPAMLDHGLLASLKQNKIASISIKTRTRTILLVMMNMTEEMAKQLQVGGTRGRVTRRGRKSRKTKKTKKTNRKTRNRRHQ